MLALLQKIRPCLFCQFSHDATGDKSVLCKLLSMAIGLASRFKMISFFDFEDKADDPPKMDPGSPKMVSYVLIERER